MAYPFAQMPTVDQFVAWAICQGAVCKGPASFRGPRGFVQYSWLERKGGRWGVSHPVTARMAPNQVRQACSDLSLDPAEWGLDLDGLMAGCEDEPEAEA